MPNMAASRPVGRLRREVSRLHRKSTLDLVSSQHYLKKKKRETPHPLAEYGDGEKEKRILLRMAASRRDGRYSPVHRLGGGERPAFAGVAGGARREAVAGHVGATRRLRARGRGPERRRGP